MKFLTALFLLWLMVSPVQAQTTVPEGPAYGMQSHSVTSAEKCFAQLDPDEALDVRKNATMPWQECQKRLQEKLKREKEAKKAEEAEAQKEKPAPVAQTSRNYLRIRQPGEEAEKTLNKKAEKNTKKEEEE